MRLQFYFKHLSTKAHLIEYAEHRISNVINLLDPGLKSRVSFSKDKDLMKVSFYTHARDKKPVEVTAESDDFFKSIDLAYDKLVRSLRKRKEKYRQHRSASTTQALHQLAVQEELNKALYREAIDADHVIRTA